MDKLRLYLKGLDAAGQERFALRCGTSIGYLRKLLSVNTPPGDAICIAIERESKRAIWCEDLRPDTDWAYIRGTARRKVSVAA